MPPHVLTIGNISGALSIIFALSAYAQKERVRFLIINMMAILAIGVNFYIHGGYVGAFAEAVMFFVHVTALMIGKNARKKMSLIAPPLVVSYYIYLHGTKIGHEIFMSLAILFFVTGAYQTNMKANKILFMIGLFSLSLYSLATGAYEVMFANIIGILVLAFSYVEIGREDKKKKLLPLSRVKTSSRV